MLWLYNKIKDLTLVVNFANFVHLLISSKWSSVYCINAVVTKYYNNNEVND
ncbi:hypothetical protein TOT_040000352 [Theileria orientalis strain Shintoku]|uniref:Uncharacterized protein n=1 Tax=Theileria orientalis strain Shintoku TaxID=869250 RepID=J4C960_THEOR|nr:hypothetical protein TOT_040000352 [Theileria orientalis strain Shintoku]PVC52520.1 hypothetical protein MACL_00000725 [Theileria orientalis]BAM41973.1 hypothetical protein TOT_040000352 [Theileria orientalis strain Shintoku]|eukprot:XP_009692274.1 hypothetical protein TOT_040000352 [Theileria orientalis strain Shintoku]